MQPQELDRCLAALSHSTRREILTRLSRGPMKITELADVLPIALNTVSKHVRVLEGAALVRREVIGRNHQLTLDGTRLVAVQNWMATTTSRWTKGLAALEAHLDRKAGRNLKGKGK